MLQLNQELSQTYSVMEEIGSGGGGTVYKVYHKNLKKEVVFKQIHANLLNSNVRAEVDILKNLKSPYLPQVLDFLQVDGEVYTVMDYIPGQSLKEVLQGQESFSQQRVLKWMDQLCQAVEQLHTQEPPIIHGDIKPANIMLTPKDDICLIDFNISGDFQDSDIMGFTAGYAAPEQMESVAEARKRLKEQGNRRPTETVPDGRKVFGTAGNQEDATEVLDDATETQGDATEVLDDATETQGDATEVLDDATETQAVVTEIQADAGATLKDSSHIPPTKVLVDQRSDIYSIGATMYHLLSGKRPNGETIQPLGELNSRIEDSLVFIIMKCLEKNPQSRYQSIQELHKAVLNVHKSSIAYKRLLRKQLLIRLVLMAGVVGFAALAGLGRVRMKQEKLDMYAGLVETEKEAREQQDYEQVEDSYRQAVALYSDGAEAIFEMAQALYQQHRYEETIDFIEESALPVVTDAEILGDLYFLYGNSYFELEQYENAKTALQQAIGYNGDNSQFYRDYAITLARLGETEAAEAELEKAIQYQLAFDGIYYVQGEIFYAQENWEEAADSFQKCIGESMDDYMKMRAYLLGGESLKNQEGGLEQCKALLEEAHRKLPAEYLNAILEELAQAYIDLANETGDAQYDKSAIAALAEIIGYGWGIYNTYNNIAILCQKNQMYEKEAEVLQTMLDQYGENYNTYKRLAFMEAGKQILLENDQRDFSQFADYYEKANTLYQEQLSNNQTDLEMSSLQDLYQQAVDGGWIAQ